MVACQVFIQNKFSNQVMPGLLHPLLVPTCPWSHISLDFVTGLPTSESNTPVLTVVDRFSKIAHFLPNSHLLKRLLDFYWIKFSNWIDYLWMWFQTTSAIISQKKLSPKESLLFLAWCLCQSLLRLPSPVQWSDRMIQRGSGEGDLVSCFPHSFTLEQTVWVEYTHNSLPCASSGLSPFQCVYSYQPPSFAALEKEVGFPQLWLWCRHTWAKPWQSLLKPSAIYKMVVDRQRTNGPLYQVGQWV